MESRYIHEFQNGKEVKTLLRRDGETLTEGLQKEDPRRIIGQDALTFLDTQGLVQN